MVLSALLLAVAAQPTTLPANLDDLSKRAFRYFWDQSNPTTGLTKDRATNAVGTDTHTVASAAATGYALAAYSIGAARGWMPKATLQARVLTTLNFLKNKASKQNGWFYHFVDWSTGARVWSSEVSSIDTSILLGGILMAQMEFPDPTVSSLCKSIEGAIDWKWMLTDGGTKPTSLTYCMGWKPESGFLPYRWNHYNENMMLYIQGLGLNSSIPAGTWSAFSRDTITYDNVTLLFGGPLFIHQLSQGYLDFTGKRDSLGYDYWVASRLATLMNRQYCIDNPNHFAGYSSQTWGLSACDTPTGYSADGAPGNIVDDGTIAPSSSIASLPFTPTESSAAAVNLKLKYPSALSRYGFSNGLNPTKNWVDTDVIGIDLGFLLLGIENYRDNLPHKLSMANAINAVGFVRAGFRTTNEGPLTSRPLRRPPVP